MKFQGVVASLGLYLYGDNHDQGRGLRSFGELNPASRGVYRRIRTLGVSTGGGGVGPLD
jgi:hypothetical protein